VPPVHVSGYTDRNGRSVGEYTQAPRAPLTNRAYPTSNNGSQDNRMLKFLPGGIPCPGIVPGPQERKRD
jgi:hypothetical protein